MRTPTCSTRLLAALFLVGLAAITLWTWLAGTPPGEVGLVPCPVRSLTGVPCPGCGMTRACVALARGQFSAAWTLHPFAFLLLPLATLAAWRPKRARAQWRRAPESLRSAAVGLALVLALGLWVARIA